MFKVNKKDTRTGYFIQTLLYATIFLYRLSNDISLLLWRGRVRGGVGVGVGGWVKGAGAVKLSSRLKSFAKTAFKKLETCKDDSNSIVEYQSLLVAVIQKKFLALAEKIIPHVPSVSKFHMHHVNSMHHICK